jgi:Protein of unknown function (DUF2726)
VTEPTTLPYQRKESFLTPAQIAYFKVLRVIFADKYMIFARVNVLDLCDVLDRPQNQEAFDKIDRKQVDFVLCHPRTLKPMVAIELEDASQDLADRGTRDKFLDEVFRAIGMKLVRPRFRHSYSVAEVTQTVEAALAAAA